MRDSGRCARGGGHHLRRGDRGGGAPARHGGAGGCGHPRGAARHGDTAARAGGLYYNLENKIIAAIKPRPAFLPVLRMLNGVMEFGETRGLLVTDHWCERNRRATSHRSHLSLIPLEKLFPGRENLFVYNHPPIDQPDAPSHSQRHPGPDEPHWKIPVSQWPTVLRRIDQGEPLRKIAGEYHISHEAVRRVVRAARKQEQTG
jgi:hypothetical protein